MSIITTGDRIFIRETPPEKKSGFTIAYGKDNLPNEGVIIACGPGRSTDPMQYAEGDKVLYSKGAGTRVVILGEEVVIMREGDAFCVIR